MSGPCLKLLIAVLVLNQLVVHGLGGAVLVRCQGADGHEAAEIAHFQACHDSGSGHTHGPEDDSALSVWTVQHDGHCVDASLDSRMTTRQGSEAAQVKLDTTTLLWIAPAPATIKANALSAPLHFSPGSPDSAAALARNVILLI